MTVGFLCGVPWRGLRDVVDDDWILARETSQAACPFMGRNISSPLSIILLEKKKKARSVLETRQNLFVERD